MGRRIGLIVVQNRTRHPTESIKGQCEKSTEACRKSRCDKAMARAVPQSARETYVITHRVCSAPSEKKPVVSHDSPGCFPVSFPCRVQNDRPRQINAEFQPNRGCMHFEAY